MRNVLLLTNEPATINAVSSVLDSNGKLASDDICRDLKGLVSRLQRSPAPAALVDIDGDHPHEVLAGLQSVASQFIDTRFVVLSRAMQSDLLLGAMRAGVRHFLLKESITTDLDGILNQLWPAGSMPTGAGSAVTILSCGGGCGATTLAVNLATELQILNSESRTGPALIVDLDPYYGAVSAYLGIEGDYGIFDVLARSGAMDAELIQSTSLAHSESLRTLISSPRERLGEPTTIDTERLGAAVEACKSTYDWTVIDAPRIPVQAAAELGRRSVATLLLLQLTVKDIRSARRMITALDENGLPMNTLQVIGTRYRKRRGLIEPAEARQALALTDAQPLHLLSNDYYAVTDAVNLGKPLAQTAPRSDFRKEVQKLAASISAPVKAVR